MGSNITVHKKTFGGRGKRIPRRSRKEAPVTMNVEGEDSTGGNIADLGSTTRKWGKKKTTGEQKRNAARSTSKRVTGNEES